jgi:hypothetical protein
MVGCQSTHYFRGEGKVIYNPNAIYKTFITNGHDCIEVVWPKRDKGIYHLNTCRLCKKLKYNYKEKEE